MDWLNTLNLTFGELIGVYTAAYVLAALGLAHEVERPVERAVAAVCASAVAAQSTPCRLAVLPETSVAVTV